MRALVIVKLEVISYTCLWSWNCGIVVEMDRSILDAEPEQFDEHIVEGLEGFGSSLL